MSKLKYFLIGFSAFVGPQAFSVYEELKLDNPNPLDVYDCDSTVQSLQHSDYDPTPPYNPSEFDNTAFDKTIFDQHIQKDTSSTSNIQ